VVRTSIGSSNGHALFGESTTLVLDPGKSGRTDHPSDAAAASLQLPAKTGLFVQARFFIALYIGEFPGAAGARQVRVAEADGVPFTFDWLYPDDAGFDVIKARLHKILDTPVKLADQPRLLSTFLGIRDVAQSVSLDELLAALDSRSGPFDERCDIAAHLARRFNDHPAVVRYYQQHLEGNEAVAIDDLLLTDLWVSSYIDPLVRMYENDPRKFSYALSVLHKHRMDWIKDSKVSRRLSAVVERQYPQLRHDVRQMNKDQLLSWSGAVFDLSRTGDRAAIARLRSLLDDKRAFATAKDMSLTFDENGLCVPPLRVCDVALEGILTLLDGDARIAYRKMREPRVNEDADTAYAEFRDRMCAQLKTRLAAENKGD
jgi:hypothetical protein